MGADLDENNHGSNAQDTVNVRWNGSMPELVITVPLLLAVEVLMALVIMVAVAALVLGWLPLCAPTWPGARVHLPKRAGTAALAPAAAVRAHRLAGAGALRRLQVPARGTRIPAGL